jgi:hypothetical protein
VDPFHQQLAQIGLEAAARYGFVLAGGYAVQAHGFLARRSEDVDLFTSADALASFSKAAADVIRAYQAAGFSVASILQGDGFARLQVSDAKGRTAKVELGVDWRARPPARFEVGPVLHVDDAIANKVATLFGRAEARDYIDVDAVLRSGRYDREDLLRLAAEADPGFDRVRFAVALDAIDRFPNGEFTVYGLSGEQVDRLREQFRSWASELRGPGATPESSVAP